MSKNGDAWIAAFHRAQSEEQLRLAKARGNLLYAWEMLEGIGVSATAWDDPHARTEVPNWVLWYLVRAADAFAAMGRGHALDSRGAPL